MKKNYFLLMLMLIFFTVTASKAQSIVGSWKKTDDILTNADGSTKSSFKTILQSMPCYADIVYTFSEKGKISEQMDSCPDWIKKMIPGQLKNANWKKIGNKLIVDSPDMPAEMNHSETKIEFVGNDKMIWTFNFSENTKMPNPGKIKQMQSIYVRVK